MRRRTRGMAARAVGIVVVLAMVATSARFVAVLALAFPDGRTEKFRGEVEGHLVWPPRGPNGFGYDPMFVPEGHARTFGEMEGHEKATLSHRACAFAGFAHAMLR